MSSISLPGLSTGIDTASLIQQLMQVESQRLNAMTTSVNKTKEKQTAVNQLQSKLNSFRSTLNNISDTSKLKAFSATTSDEDTITADAGASATEGSHSVKIKQLATAERWVHSGFEYSTSYVGEGNFIYSYNNTERVIQTTDQTTLNDLVTQINNDPDNPGVTASLLKYDSGDGNEWHLVLAGKESGADYQITVNTSNTEVHTATTTLTQNGSNAAKTAKLKDLTCFSGVIESGSTADQIRITGARHDGTAVDVSFDVTQYTTIEDLTKEIESAFGDTVAITYKDGLIKITDTTSGVSQMTVSLAFVAGTGSSAAMTLPTISQTTEGGSKTAGIASLTAATFSETQSAQNSLIKVDDYPTGAANWISRSSNTVDDVISGVTLKLHAITGNDTDGYDNVEVNLTRNTEQLKEKINAMIEGYNTVVMYLDETTQYNAETKKSGILSAEYSLTSIRSQIKNPLLSIASGFGEDDSFTRPSDIGLEIGADGMLKLDETAFDEAVSENYLDVLALIGAQKTGLSSGNDAAYISFYAASKYTDAGEYDVQVVVDGSGNITSAKIKLTSETTYRDMTIDGTTISGSSAVDSNKKPLYPEFDLNLTVDTSKTGTLNATIQVKQGFSGAIYESVDSMLQSSGRLPIAKKSVADQITSYEKRIDNEESRLEKVELRLKLKYARLEAMLTQIQRQFSGVSAMS
jgi:flagellar hook-associated protein 2